MTCHFNGLNPIIIGYEIYNHCYWYRLFESFINTSYKVYNHSFWYRLLETLSLPYYTQCLVCHDMCFAVEQVYCLQELLKNAVIVCWFQLLYQILTIGSIMAIIIIGRLFD